MEMTALNHDVERSGQAETGRSTPETIDANVTIIPNPNRIPDVNVYQQKKTLAQGMMDLALLSANANQLRYVLGTTRNAYFFVNLTLIGLSMFIQIAVGIGLILNSRYNVKNEVDICKANRVNNLTVIGIFLITVVNIMVSSFTIADTGVNAAPLL